MEEKLIDILINTVNRIETKVDRVIDNMVTKEDCKNSREACPMKDKAKTTLEIIKESKLLIAGISGGLIAVIKTLLDLRAAF